MINRTKKRLLFAFGLFALVGAIVVIVAARRMTQNFEPYIRDQAIQYLQKRFDSEVELAALHVSVPQLSIKKLILDRGQGTFAHVDGEGIVLRHRGNRDVPPMFVMKSFSFVVDLGTLFETQKTVHSVRIDGMEVNIPPKGSRPNLNSGGDDHADTGVIIEEVLITDSILRILPRQQDKTPLQFDLHRIRLETAGKNVAMKYDATLTNAKPPGKIQSKGTFGPWAATEPGDTALTGDYQFKDADLGVFDGIGGILQSTGQFTGTLDAIDVDGQATVPDFRLETSGNRVPLSTRFKVHVDGTNGNTILKPVMGRLGTTDFTTSGGVIKREKHSRRGIALDVNMPNGNLRDLLTLAMKGKSFMEGRIKLKAKIDVPPLTGKVMEKLLLDGTFEITQARFLHSKVQDQIDTLSRRGQGKPKAQDIVEVPSGLAGSFNLAKQVITFRSLSFAVPGAGVDLAGNYNLKADRIDFHGTLKLQAKVSQTMTGWKRWVLKPVDPFFSKQGAGTLLRIQVTGTSKEPHFGRDQGPDHQRKDHEASIERAKPEADADKP